MYRLITTILLGVAFAATITAALPPHATGDQPLPTSTA